MRRRGDKGEKFWWSRGWEEPRRAKTVAHGEFERGGGGPVREDKMQRARRWDLQRLDPTPPSIALILLTLHEGRGWHIVLGFLTLQPEAACQVTEPSCPKKLELVFTSMHEDCVHLELKKMYDFSLV
jgi:hypothetical protein